MVYLHARIDVLLDRIQRRGRPFEEDFDPEYLTGLSEAYQHYFAHYDGPSPLLDLDTSEINYVDSDAVLDDLYERIIAVAEGNEPLPTVEVSPVLAKLGRV